VGPWGTFLRIAVASLALPLALVVARAPHGPLWAAGAAGAVTGLFGSAVETTLGPTLAGGLRWLLWSLLTALALWSVTLLWPTWPVSAWTPPVAGALTGLAEAALPADWLRT
jgi:hypothetical protein